jgi:asparagine synthase (glutamine-hydrolysing)
MAASGIGTEMAHGLEGRVPFLDHVLSHFTAVPPPGVKIRDGVEKWLLREGLKDILPPAFRARHKRPFTAPPPAQFAREFYRDRHSPTALADSPFFDPVADCRALDRLEFAADPALKLVLTSVLLQEWFGLLSTRRPGQGLQELARFGPRCRRAVRGCL